jgi:hypothetical protein
MTRSLLSSILGAARWIGLIQCSGVSGSIQLSQQFGGRCEGQDQSSDDRAHGSGVAAFPRFYTVGGKRHGYGSLVNCYSNDVIDVDFRRGFPTDDRAGRQSFAQGVLHNLQHNSTACAMPDQEPEQVQS